MMRSMFSAISGLKNHQLKMDVIGNNIANVNTYGFKASRVTFKDAFYQTISPATGNSGDTGGMNPSQIGLGMSVQSVDTIVEPGGIARTDRPLDFTIEGEGYFVLRKYDGDDAAGPVYYSRAGNFYLDDQGYLVNADGYYVMGVEGDSEVEEDPVDLMRIQIDYEQFTSVKFDKNGVVAGIDVDGARVMIGRMAVATCVNPSGLNKEGNNLLTESNNSGPMRSAAPGDIGTGTLAPGGLEMSKVDLSQEFTDMIITQRGFQANSRVITVSDTMLEELVNLKR